MAKEQKKRVDVFADEHIDDGRIVDIFLKYAKVECGWSMDEEHYESALSNVLKSFTKEHPTLASKVKVD